MKTLSSSQMRRIDHAARRRSRIPLLVLMDNAGRCVAEAARARLRGGKRMVAVLSGGGNNGGDGIAAARYLAGWGYSVRVYWLKNPATWKGDAALHYRMAKAAGVAMRPFMSVPASKRILELRQAALVIDALLGTGVSGHLRVPYFDAIAAMNASGKPILSVDIPSGLDPDSGRVLDIAVRARWTVTMVAVKKGLFAPGARRYAGRLLLADIGVPVRLVRAAR